MEILNEQASQQRDAFQTLLVDLERKISSGEKFFTRQETKTGKSTPQTVFYLIDEVGESDCVYRYRPLSDYFAADPSDEETMRGPETSMSFHLVAIRTQHNYYICRPNDLGIDNQTLVPAYVEFFSHTVEYYNEYLKNTAFSAFYHKLQTYDMKPNDAAVFRARQAILKGEDISKAIRPSNDLPESRPSFSDLDVMCFVCNGISPEDAADQGLKDESVINKYRTYKSENAMIQKLMRDPDLVSAEERTLWDAVASQPNDARTLTVTFQFRGRTESLQIKPEAIRDVILNKVSFKLGDIAPSSRSDFFAMGAAPWSNGEKSTLTYEHITKISYWDTVLYDKKAAKQKEQADVIESELPEPNEESNAEESAYAKQHLRSPLHHR